MVPKLETIKGGGGSIKVGTMGTISNLMSRELETPKTIPQLPLPPIKITTSTESVSIPYQALTPRKIKPKPQINNGASTSESGIECSKKSPENKKVKPHNRRSSQLPMLESGNVSIEATPHRERKSGSHIVEIVNIKCGHPDRAWATPITSRLKKLGFSKLSENSIV